MRGGSDCSRRRLFWLFVWGGRGAVSSACIASTSSVHIDRSSERCKHAMSFRYLPRVVIAMAPARVVCGASAGCCALPLLPPTSVSCSERADMVALTALVLVVVCCACTWYVHIQT